MWEVLALGICSRRSSSVVWHMCIKVEQSKARGGTTITKTHAKLYTYLIRSLDIGSQWYEICFAGVFIYQK